MAGPKRRRASADPIAAAVSERALDAIGGLAKAWPGQRYDDLRGAVIYTAFEMLAQHGRMEAVPLEQLEPRIPLIAVLGLRVRFGDGLRLDDVTPEHFGCVHESLADYGLMDGEVVSTSGRRKGGVHFTPRSLTSKIVARTLEPLLACLLAQGEVTAERVLSLRICDPAVGAGAFLLEVVRQLAPLVLAHGGARDLDEAKRLVALHSAHGVDKCPFAVYATKLALRLECRADQMPADWLDDNIKVGDALVGLDREQFVSFNWRRGQPEIPFLAELWDRAAAAGARFRQDRIERLSRCARCT